MAKVKPFHRVDKNGDIICGCCGVSFPLNYAAKRCRSCAPHWANLRVRAIVAVHEARRKGKIKPLDGVMCADCGKRATQYDHRDYFKPLNVTPVCLPCNLKRGSAKQHPIDAIKAYLGATA